MAISASTPLRSRQNLNRDWTFRLGDHDGAERPAYDDSAWDRVGLPHSFDLPYFRTPEFYVGYGWYRKRFDLGPDPKSRRIFLEFEGAFQDAEVFVNGVPVGRHRGGYTGFSFDVTGAAKAGDNVLAVRLNNNWDPRLAPRAGEHIFCGGLYRDVHLVVADPLHVTWCGTSVTTPTVSAASATVNVKTEVRNDASVDKQCTVWTQILDPDDRVVTEMRATREISPGQTFEFDQASDAIADPKLWHPDHPNLYSVRTTVLDGEQPVDDGRSPLGFRWFDWTADGGFFLNGRRLYLRGVNAHQDHAGWGIAVTQAAAYRDVRLTKEAGFNFIRGAHYPHHPAFAEACDRLGLIFWSENCFWGKGGFGPEGYWNASAYPVNPEDFDGFAESCKATLRDMIRTNRNHPSIVIWSMTNEAFFTYNIARAKALVSELLHVSRSLDPTRLAAVGGCQRGDFDRLGGVAGYNGDGATLFIDPGVPSMVSEYGAVNKGQPGEYGPYFGDLQAEEFPWRGGQAIWCGFDYGTIAGRQGLKGILDHYRLPKRSWYWYRNAYRGIAPPAWPQPGTPAKLLLAADKTTIRGTDATDDVQLVVTVLDADGKHVSNTPPVTLTIESGPGEFPTGPTITFDPATNIRIVDGQAAMAFRSYHGGTSVIRATSPGLRDAIISVTTEGEPAFVPGETAGARPRPYRPPELSAAAIKSLQTHVNVAKDRPSRASSEAKGRPARLGNDGDAASAWVAADDVGAWWQVDMEGFYQVSTSRVTFPEAANYRFRIEISEDGKAWTPAVDRSESVNTAPIREDIYPPGATARYVRLTFTSLPPGVRASICEVEVYGVLAPSTA
ncbi:MAG: beta-galactosidase [Mycobacterium sp.]|nr:beta-galactosidase [Mycobacterium sp.]